jgi:hypothetical protein
LKEISVKRDQPVWRTDEDERPVGLRVTRAGLKTLGVEPSKADEADAEEATAKQGSRKAATKRAVRVAQASNEGRRAGSKQALVISLLSRAKGATLHDLVAATGWLPHSMRAALTGLRKKGHALSKDENASGKTVYRIGSAAPVSRRTKDAA